MTFIKVGRIVCDYPFGCEAIFEQALDEAGGDFDDAGRLGWYYGEDDDGNDVDLCSKHSPGFVPPPPPPDPDRMVLDMDPPPALLQVLAEATSNGHGKGGNGGSSGGAFSTWIAGRLLPWARVQGRHVARQ